ncbi:MAG: adenine deaminase, partial [Pseudomonadota bacterium]
HRLLRAARGLEPADLVFKGGRIVNVFTGRLEEADLAVAGGLIVGLGRYQGREEIDVAGRFLSPGFIDPHLHLESTMLCPAELARVLLPRGTTAVVADPHEIANVLGLKGVRFLIKASQDLPLEVHFMAPSSVPASRLETSGAELDLDDLRTLLEEPRVLGLAEVMNFPGLVAGDQELIEKINLFSGKYLDGHAPLLTGPDLSAYVLTGINTEHECTRLEEAEEKLARGMRIFIREGSQAKNLKNLLPLVSDHNYRRISFCTDDRHPDDLAEKGHLDHVLRRAVSLGLDPLRALALATINPAEAYGLKRTGALAPGYRADVVVLSSLESFEVERVFKDGREAASDGEATFNVSRTDIPEWASPMNMAPLDPEGLKLRAAGPKVRVIKIIEGQILTDELVAPTPAANGWLTADPDRDLARLVVIERHHRTGNLGQGLVSGFGFKKGAIASSVAHDSHNIVAAGLSEPEILLAVDTVRKMHGGLAVVAGERVLAELALPLAGLMSPKSAQEVASAVEKVGQAAQEIGSGLASPFMYLSFLALPVVPRLKLTDRGLVDVKRFGFTSLFLE